MPNGRAPGTPNKTTGEIKTAISMAVSANVGKISEWLNEVAAGIKGEDGKWIVKPDPGLAVKLTADLTNFVLPQLRAAAIATTNVNASMENLNPASVALLQMDEQSLMATFKSMDPNIGLPTWLRTDTVVIDVTPSKENDRG